MTAERLQCVVPGCKHTRGDRKDDPVRPGMEWICGDHWNTVPAFLRRRKSRLYRRYRRAFGDNGYWLYPPGSPDRLTAARLDRMCRASWSICRRAAIERGVGI